MKLSLIGAGPGDKKLITLKAIEILKEADAILYDALVNPEILEYAEKAEKIFVGKRKSAHHLTQNEINELIIRRAVSGQHVARLKSGDPFIFGRGYEEMEIAHRNNIPVEVIPGVSSIQVGGPLKIPLTHRGTNDSFWVVTATNTNGNLSKDLLLAAHSASSLILLMGLHKLEEIMQLMAIGGKNECPVAIISKGSWPDEQILKGTVGSIVSLYKQNPIPAPSIIIISPTVALFTE